MSISRRQFSGLAVTAAASLALSSVPALAGSKRKGSLSGRKGYSVQGTVKVKKEGGRTKVVFSDDYLFDPSKNPPDIKIGFGNGETYAKGSKIHEKLSIKQGAATFDVPSNINTDQYSELYIYCEKFTVILAVAPLN